MTILAILADSDDSGDSAETRLNPACNEQELTELNGVERAKGHKRDISGQS